MTTSTEIFKTSASVLVLIVSLAGCSSQGEQSKSHFSGTITVSSEIDSTADYSGFEVAVLNAGGEDGIDTLGYAVSEENGTFSMMVDATERGVYPLEIRRNDRLLAREQFVVAVNDSASLEVEFPNSRSILLIRSVENGAWLAYRNTKALHNQRLAELSTSETATLNELRSSVLQASEIMWSLSDTYPETIGAELARAESVVMLEGWDDSLVVSRSSQITPDESGFLNVIQVLRRSTARMHGVAAAVDSLEVRMTPSDSEQRDAIQAEIALTYLDSLDVASARQVADEMQTGASTEAWRNWATAAIYEMDTLMPGMAAPNPNFKDLAGRDLDLNFFLDATILLEFIDPSDVRTVINYKERTDLLKLSDGTNFQVITVSLNRDRVSNEIYLDNKTTAEAYIVPSEGADSEIARLFNVRTLPKRFLIHDGKIISKYSGRSVAGIRADVLTVIN